MAAPLIEGWTAIAKGPGLFRKTTLAGIGAAYNPINTIG
jgi:hypothetical protein